MNHKNVCVQYVRSNFTSLWLKSWSCFNYSYREFPLANSVFLWHQRHLCERWFDSCTRMKDCYDTAQLDSWMPPKTEWPLVRNEGRLIYVSTRGSCVYSIYLLLLFHNCFHRLVYFNGNLPSNWHQAIISTNGSNANKLLRVYGLALDVFGISP